MPAQRLLALPFVLAAGCAPTLLVSNIANPTKTTDKTSVTQSYEIGPYKENHRYELTLSDWTPTSVALSAKLVDSDQCALPRSYTFTLVDDHDVRSSLQATGEPTQTSEVGRANKQLTVGVMAGTFNAAVGAAKSVTVQMRPAGGAPCPSLDFRWVLQ